MAKPNKKLQAAARRAQNIQNGTSFSESALEKLTERIDHNLVDNQQNKRKKPPTGDNPSQNRKRQRNGADKPQKQDKKPGAIERDVLLAEIKALGGDEKDLELIEGIDSDEEEEDGRQPNGKRSKADEHTIDKGLKAELAAMSKELGFANLQPIDESEDEADEAEASGDDDQGDEEDEEVNFDDQESSVVEEKPSKEANKPEPQVKVQPQPSQPKKPGQLVSRNVPSLAALLTTNPDKSRCLNLEPTGMLSSCQSCPVQPTSRPAHQPVSLSL